MAKHILNLTLNILDKFLSWSPIGLILLSLFPIGQYLHFHSNLGSRKSANISHTVHVMKVPWRSPMHVHNVAGESADYYSHHGG
jgi:hypothetical protein